MFACLPACLLALVPFACSCSCALYMYIINYSLFVVTIYRLLLSVRCFTPLLTPSLPSAQLSHALLDHVFGSFLFTYCVLRTSTSTVWYHTCMYMYVCASFHVQMIRVYASVCAINSGISINTSKKWGRKIGGEIVLMTMT